MRDYIELYIPDRALLTEEGGYLLFENDDIITDEWYLKFSVIAGRWKRVIHRPVTVKYCLNGASDVSFGSFNNTEWQGQVKAPYVTSSTRDNIDDLREVLYGNRSIYMTDHHSETYPVVLLGPFEETSVTAMEDSIYNYYLVNIVFKEMKEGIYETV